MRRTAGASVALLLASCLSAASAAHVWDKQELIFTSARDYPNPYTEVVVWVDLSGPGFQALEIHNIEHRSPRLAV